MFRRFLVATCLGLALYACKDDLELPPPAGDPGTNQPIPNTGGSGTQVPRTDASTPLADAGGTDGSDAGSCTDLALTGTVRDENALADEPPAGTGGTIGDGIYNLNIAQLYVGAGQLPGPTGNAFRSTLRITGGATYERVAILSTQAGAGQETRVRGVITSVGVNATISVSCPAPTQEQVTFTADANTLVLTDLITKRQWTYARAP